MLRKNQVLAIETSKQNDFSNGIHYHATGTGKSWIAMNILKEYNIKYPKHNILWLCERKDVLSQQFNKETVNDRNFNDILSKFVKFDFSLHKKSNWTDSLNATKFWKKPFLCIINRGYLTYSQNYKKIKTNIDLVIHDECHSIENKTTQEFYKWLLSKNSKTKIIGFSATPELISPLNTILSKYSIYDGFKDKVILPPRIMWIKSQNPPTNNTLMELIKPEINKLPYKKIIVWCGMIDECIELAEEWSDNFRDYSICIDFNNISKCKQSNFKDFEYFYNASNNSILFCAVKHREGSDIPNIDCCIFMDLVENRGERTFIQCMGRVLRTDKQGKKKYGLIIDLKAKSTISICNRIQHYLQLKDIFPWNYTYSKSVINHKPYFINFLDMVERPEISSQIHLEVDKVYTKNEIYSYFKRDIPNEPEYTERLNYEIELILKKNLFGNMVRALDILKLTNSIPHITRGSCGSSLVCYLLGISHVDPVKYNISFARFINRFRDTLPDIDFDFPHNLRDEVFLKLFQKWGNKVARISNHNYYHEKSAVREAIRQNGIRKFISKYNVKQEIAKLDKDLQAKIEASRKKIEGTFRGYSLHCGGIVYYPTGIPEDKLLPSSEKTVMKQVILNKVNVAEDKNFKIDILSSRGLTQLYQIVNYQSIDFDKHLGDPKTIELLSSGNNIGITLAETPLMRKAFLMIKPKTILDVAICLSIIRPAAKDAKREFEMGLYKRNNLIFDDDVIFILAQITSCDEEFADKLRRGFCKNDRISIDYIEQHIDKKYPRKKKQLLKILNNLRKYGFCKAHALSYAQLVWQLAYQKANNPKKFWESTLKNVVSCYRNWVHLFEARLVGVSIQHKTKHKSIYAKRKKDKIVENTNEFEQLQKYGYWNMECGEFYQGCYYLSENGSLKFRGLVASSRMLGYGKLRKLVLFLGVGPKQYIEVVVKGEFYFDSKKVIAEGKGIRLKDSIICFGDKVRFI